MTQALDQHPESLGPHFTNTLGPFLTSAPSYFLNRQLGEMEDVFGHTFTLKVRETYSFSI